MTSFKKIFFLDDPEVGPASGPEFISLTHINTNSDTFHLHLKAGLGVLLGLYGEFTIDSLKEMVRYQAIKKLFHPLCLLILNDLKKCS